MATKKEQMEEEKVNVFGQDVCDQQGTIYKRLTRKTTALAKTFADAVVYDAAGRPYDMRFPAGGNIWRRQGYHAWNTTHTTYAGNGEGRLWYIHVGTNQGLLDRLNLAYDYDSYGNVERHYDNAGYNSFSYDDQNRAQGAPADAYTKVYDNDTSGRLTSYQGVNQPVSTAFPGHAIKKSGYTYNANGNLITRAGKTLEWDVQNRLSKVKNGSTTEESYLYDDDGIRVKKTVGSTTTYYPFANYEQSGSTVTKYYFPSTSSGQALAANESP